MLASVCGGSSSGAVAEAVAAAVALMPTQPSADTRSDDSQRLAVSADLWVIFGTRWQHHLRGVPRDLAPKAGCCCCLGRARLFPSNLLVRRAHWRSHRARCDGSPSDAPQCKHRESSLCQRRRAHGCDEVARCSLQRPALTCNRSETRRSTPRGARGEVGSIGTRMPRARADARSCEVPRAAQSGREQCASRGFEMKDTPGTNSHTHSLTQTDRE